MADAAISATIEVALGTIISLASDRIGLIRGFKKESESLSKYAKSIQGFLADADSKMLSPNVKDWIMRLEEEVFKAENVLDELNCENLRRDVKYRNDQIKKKLCFFFSFCNTIGFRSRLASKIRDINADFDRIIGEANDLGLVMRFQIEAALLADADRATTSRRQTDSIRVPNAVGRAEDEANIVKMLLSPSERPLSLLPIIGTGGLGKTTLAKSVFNNPQIDGHFKKRIWVCVAKEIEVMDLYKFILESSTGEKVEVDQRNAIIQKIQQQLGEERYFIVLDDVWNHEQGLWNDLLCTFEGLNPTNGSWCLFTTRLRQMEETLSKHLKMKFDPYFLGKLTEGECWSILKNKVLVAGEEVPEELEAIKEQVLRRCGGLPLAASLIGGLLLSKGKENWRSIMEESLLDANQNDAKQIVKVSFDHLSPASVKKCFAYCSMFPQDTTMDKDLLIELWMAEGFLQLGPRNKRTVEEMGEDHIRILLQSSLLENVTDEEGYKMHDLVHDFAKSVSNPKRCNRERYLALESFEGMIENAVKEISPSLRTLFLERRGISGDILSKFKYLHALKLSKIDVLPASIGKLKHLHFLDISNSRIERLPDSFYKLYNLQTLRIDDRNLNGLPERVSNLISLSRVHCNGNFKECRMPLELGRLIGLITLELFNISEEKGRRIEELGTLKQLKGSLGIRNLQLVDGKEEAKLAKLCEKPNLSRLKFEWSGKDDFGGDDDVLEGLQPNPNLQELKIRNFKGCQFPNWFMNLSALKELKLCHCYICIQLPTLGQLPSLRRLVCRGLEAIRIIGQSFYGNLSSADGRFFPALKSLSLEYLPNLVEWKDAEEKVVSFPVLETLNIQNCCHLTTAAMISNFPSIRNLDIGGGCSVSLVEKILSSGILTLSSLQLIGDSSEPIQSLQLKKGCGGDSNSEEDVFGFELTLCGRDGILSNETLARLWNSYISNLQHLSLDFFGEGLISLGGIGFDVGRTSLRSLDLHCCENLRIEDVFEFQSLRRLRVYKCPMFDLKIPPPNNNKGQRCLLTSLEELSIRYCSGLNSLPVEMLEACSKSLRCLAVQGCHNLVSFPFGYLINLEDLTLDHDYYSSSEFDWSGLMCLTKLRKLCLIGRCSESLPDQLQFFTNLTELKLEDFGIEALPNWIGNLASLEILNIWYCPKLQYFPSVDAMRGLTKLTCLVVSRCPLLKERCTPQRDTDSEWFKISHIPKIRIH